MTHSHQQGTKWRSPHSLIVRVRCQIVFSLPVPSLRNGISVESELALQPVDLLMLNRNHFLPLTSPSTSADGFWLPRSPHAPRTGAAGVLQNAYSLRAASDVKFTKWPGRSLLAAAQPSLPQNLLPWSDNILAWTRSERCQRQLFTNSSQKCAFSITRDAITVTLYLWFALPCSEEATILNSTIWKKGIRTEQIFIVNNPNM